VVAPVFAVVFLNRKVKPSVRVVGAGVNVTTNVFVPVAVP